MTNEPKMAVRDDPHKPPINPITRRVPSDGGVTATQPEPLDDGTIPQSAPVWEGGDPGTAVPNDPDPPNPDTTYWPNTVEPQVKETPLETVPGTKARKSADPLKGDD